MKSIVKLNDTGCFKLFGFYINYGKLKINNEKCINLVFPQQYKTNPYVFISLNAKKTLFNNKGNAIYTNNITNKGFNVISQNSQRINDVAEEVSWFAVGRI